MLRAVLALGGTAAGLVAILSFKTHPAAVASDQSPVTPSPTGKSAPMAKQPMTKSGSKQSGGSGTGSGTMTATHTVTGAAENTQYGPMQVELTMTGKKITNVKVVQQTNDGSESQQIDAMAIPKLTAETLTAQSARIDAVSGATYTSQGYIQSLQSALNKPM